MRMAVETQASRAQTEIGELNLTYMLLAQRLIREDKATAMYRLGLSEEVTDALAAMPLTQLVQLCTAGVVLCRLRLDDQTVLAALLKDNQTMALQQAHVSILMGSRTPKEASDFDNSLQEQKLPKKVKIPAQFLPESSRMSKA